MTKKETINSFEEAINRITTPIFERVLKETTKNHMSVGGVGHKKKKYCIVHLHNCRLYFDFFKDNLDITKLKKPCFDTMVYSLKNSTEHQLNYFNKCRITIKKTQVEVQNKIDTLKKHRIKLDSNAKNRINKIVIQKITESKRVLRKFIKEYGGKSNLNILNLYCETKVWHEDFIDSVPIDAKWHDKVSKKVYNEKNVEFSNPIFASNYIKNQSIKDKEPEMMDQLLLLNTKFDRFFTEFIPIQKEFAINIKSHTKVIKQMAKGFKKFNGLLSQKRISDFTK